MIRKKDILVYGERQRLLLQANEFVCLLPHPGLRDYISNYNITFPTKEIMPDSFAEMPGGCATLAIESDKKNLSVHLHGPATKPSIVGNGANQLELLVTIEFKPAGLYALTGIDQCELIDKSISFEAVIPRLNKAISDVVEGAGSVCQLATSLDKLLMDHMAAAYHPQLIPTLQTIVACSGNIDVKKLSDEAYYSERQLNRIFKRQVGVGVKSFSRLLRINHSFRLLKTSNGLTFISDVMGFHDLSHFVRDFRSVCGITPQEFRNNMSDFYINTVKF